MLEFDALAAIALRVTIMYVYALAMLRLSGKRSIGQLAGPDVASTFIVGDMFDDIVWGEISLAKGLTGVTTIIALHWIAKVIEARSSSAKAVLDGEPVLSIRNGAFVHAGLVQERIRESGVREMLRLKGIDNLAVVREARLEVDGTLSVLRFEARRTVQKNERDRLSGLIEGD